MNDGQTLIKLDKISAAYGSQVVLHDISLDLSANQVLGIAGPNGGGKTTLVKIVLGLLKPLSGEIAFFRGGKACSHLSMGYLPQQNTFDHSFPVTVKEVVLSGVLGSRPFRRKYAAEEERRALELLEKMELSSYKDMLIGELSGGQRQRVLLARALMCQPEVLVLDEPNTFFDIKARSWMLNELKSLRTECAIIIVSHDLRDLFSISDKIAYVHHHLHLYDPSSVSISQLEEDILRSNCSN